MKAGRYRGQLWPHLGTPVRPAQPLAEDRYLVEGQAAGIGRVRKVVAAPGSCLSTGVHGKPRAAFSGDREVALTTRKGPSPTTGNWQ